MKSRDQYKYWTHDPDCTPFYYVRFVQLFGDETSSSLKGTTVIVCPVHAIVLNCTEAHRLWIIKNQLFTIGFLPIEYEATVKNDAESELENNSAQYWFTSLEKVLPEAALTLLKHTSLGDLELLPDRL